MIPYKRLFAALSAAAVLITSVGVTSFAETTEGEIDYGKYLKDDPIPVYPTFEDGTEYVPNLIPTKGETLDRGNASSSYFNLAEEGRVTSVKNQDPWGTCWAHAALASAESNMVTKGYEKNTIDYSEAHLAWFALGPGPSDTSDPLYGDAYSADDITSDEVYDMGGHYYNSIGALSRLSGAELESVVPYSITLEGAPAESTRYDSYATLVEATLFDKSDVTGIKNCLVNNGAMQVSYLHDSSYMNNNTGAYYCNTTGSNHAVTLVGWDDNYDVSNFNSSCRPSNNGAWILKNSWGTWFGNDGYFYMSYEDASLSKIVSYSMEKKDTYNKLYQYDGSLGMHSDGKYVYFDGYKYRTNATSANVFTATASDELAAVGFYTSDADVEYKVTVFTNVSTTPNTGKKVFSTSGTMTRAGYHTVNVSGVKLTKGQKFAVAVTLSGSTYHFYDKYNDKEGISYIASTTTPESATTWYDTSSYYGASPCIKAYTKAAAVAKPQNVKATAASETSVKLTWDAVSGATKYAIAYQNGTKFTTLSATCTSTTYTATGLTAGKTYKFLVQAYVDGQWSSYTTDDLVSITLPASIKPKNVKATAASETSVKLTWDAVSGATKYAIAYQNGTKFTTLTTSCTSTTYTATGLTSGKTYKFLVQAYADGKWSSYTTDDLVSITLAASTKPKNVKATAASSTSVKLTWDAVSGATKYAVAYQNGTKFTTLTTSCTSTTYTATGLTSGKTYKFLVQAYVSGQWSSYTTDDLVSVTLTASTKPQNVKATAASATSVKLTWDAVSGATKYAIAYQNGTKYTTLTTSCTSTTYTATGLTTGKTYKFLVQAYVSGKWSSYTTDDLVSVTLTGSTKPKNVKATAVSSTSAKLTWDAVSGATKYAVAYQNGTKYTTLTTSCTSTTYTATGLTAGKTYKFLVQAYVNGKWSSFTTDDLVSVTLTGSTKPQNVKAVVASTTSVKLTWDAVAGAAKYAIAYQNGTKYTTLTLTCTDTTYTATGLTTGKTYKFLVQAYVDGKWSAFTTDDLVSVTVSTYTKPQNVQATALSNTSVKLTWDAVDGATQYAIAYQNGTGYTTLSTSCTGTFFVVNELTSGRTYYFIVQAYVNGKWSSFTKDDLVTITLAH